MSTQLIQAWATGISTVLAAGTASVVGIMHALAVYRGKVTPTPTNTDTTNNGGI